MKRYARKYNHHLELLPIHRQRLKIKEENMATYLLDYKTQYRSSHPQRSMARILSSSLPLPASASSDEFLRD